MSINRQGGGVYPSLAHHHALGAGGEAGQSAAKLCRIVADEASCTTIRKIGYAPIRSGVVWGFEIVDF